MRYYTIYDSDTGKIRYSGSCAEESFEYLEVPNGCSMLEEGHDPRSGYIYSGAYFDFPPQPTEFHEWSWNVHSWIIPEAGVQNIKENVYKKIEAIRDSKKNAPIEFDGILFDADDMSVTNMRETSDRIRRGDELTAGWIGWRTYDNSIVWATSSPEDVLANLTTIRRDLEDRWQGLLKTSWIHKDNVKNLTAVSDIFNYNYNTGW